ncbi:MAG: multiheme c-type cytochrome [Sulfuricella sp.]|nr:multiheme c-type cytochrome [Sulfuricella sp.]
MKPERQPFRPWGRLFLGVLLTVLAAAGAALWLHPSPTLAVEVKKDMPFYALPFGANPFAPGELKTTDKALVNWRGVPGSTSCAECHRKEFTEWNTSIHAISDRDLVYDSTVRENTTASHAAREHGDEKGRWCESCHNPLGTLTGAVTPVSSVPEQEALEEGVTCVVCHTATHAEPLAGNGALTSNINGVARHLHPAEIMAAPARHARDMNAARTSPLIGSSALCGACHTEIRPTAVNGSEPMNLQDTYDEWRRSPYAEAGVQCQNCHMARDPAGYIGALKRGEKPPKNISHRIAGNNYLLADSSLPGDLATTLRGGPPAGINRLFSPADYGKELGQTRDQVTALLRAAASLKATLHPAQRGQLRLEVAVGNTGAGHALPTGPLDQRHMWLEIEVEDARGQPVFHSGRFDAKTGEVAPDAVMWVKHIFDTEGKKDLRHILFDADRLVYPRKPILAGETDRVAYAVRLPEKSSPPYRARVRLWYRLAFQEILTNIDRQDMGKTEGIVIPPVLMQETAASIPAAVSAQPGGSKS